MNLEELKAARDMHQQHLTARDQFAMAALTGLLAFPGSHGIAPGVSLLPDAAIDLAYEYADAAMKRRRIPA